MTTCVVCTVREGETPHESAEGWLTCWRGYARMASALRIIPELCEELGSLGYVQRDTRDGTRAERVGGKLSEDGRIIRVPSVADPVANGLPAGPLNGSKGAPRVSGSTERPTPIRIDPTDLLGPSRPGSLPIAATGYYAADQIGYLAVATELEFWARDWAEERRERSPLPTVRLLAGWLLDRLEWACGHHYALDEFAHKLTAIRTALTAEAGRFDARPDPLNAPCPDCHHLTMAWDVDIERALCVGDTGCAGLMTREEYVAYSQRLIKENPS